MSTGVPPPPNDHDRQVEDVLRALIAADIRLGDDLAGSEPLSVLIAHALDVRRLAGRAKLLLDGV
jgi:hypothetical protein